MKLKPAKFHSTLGYKGFLFFQPHSLDKEKIAANERVAHVFPNPLDNYRTPTLRLIPTRWPY